MTMALIGAVTGTSRRWARSANPARPIRALSTATVVNAGITRLARSMSSKPSSPPKKSRKLRWRRARPAAERGGRPAIMRSPSAAIRDGHCVHERSRRHWILHSPWVLAIRFWHSRQLGLDDRRRVGAGAVSPDARSTPSSCQGSGDDRLDYGILGVGAGLTTGSRPVRGYSPLTRFPTARIA